MGAKPGTRPHGSVPLGGWGGCTERSHRGLVRPAGQGLQRSLGLSQPLTLRAAWAGPPRVHTSVFPHVNRTSAQDPHQPVQLWKNLCHCPPQVRGAGCDCQLLPGMPGRPRARGRVLPSPVPAPLSSEPTYCLSPGRRGSGRAYARGPWVPGGDGGFCPGLSTPQRASPDWCDQDWEETAGLGGGPWTPAGCHRTCPALGPASSPSCSSWVRGR